MYEGLIYIRNKTLHLLYQIFAKPIFFCIDPETVHDRMTNLGHKLGAHPFLQKVTSKFFGYQNKLLHQNILGIEFKNPIGLAAGFDKNALLSDILPSVGFGFAELGSITGEPCEGNPKPRLWRLKKSKSLLIYYGLKNDGCEKISTRLEKKSFRFPVGISVAKTNCQETVDEETGIKDYVKAFKHFTYIADYFTVNISCPNAFGGEPFTEPRKLDNLLTKIDSIPTEKPVFLKLSPDLTTEQLDKILDVIANHRIHGIICTNLLKKRPPNAKDFIPDKGGIGGKLVNKRSTELVSYLYKKTHGKYVIIGCGGVSSAEDAYNKIKAGASLVQMITGMIYEGPQVISQINQGLVNLLKKDGYTNISQAIGIDHRQTSTDHRS